jgi:hypothetical protein
VGLQLIDDVEVGADDLRPDHHQSGAITGGRGLAGGLIDRSGGVGRFGVRLAAARPAGRGAACPAAATGGTGAAAAP